MNKNAYLNNMTNTNDVHGPCGNLVLACIGKLVSMEHKYINPSWKLYLIKDVRCNRNGEMITYGTLYSPEPYTSEQQELRVSEFVRLVPIDLDLE